MIGYSVPGLNVRHYENTDIDDSQSFQTCINEAIRSGVPVFVPSGKYKFSQPVIISSCEGLQIIGSGWDTRLESANGLNDFIFKFDSSQGEIRGFRITDMTISGNSLQQTSGGGIWARGAVQSFFERLHIEKCYNVGLKLDGVQAGGFGHHNRVSNCLFDGGTVSPGEGIGLRIFGSDENMISFCDFEDLGGVGEETGAVIDEAGLNMYTTCVFVNGKDGIRVKDTGRVRINNCTFDGVGKSSIIVSGYRCAVTSSTFLEGKANSSYIWMNNDGGNIVTANTFTTPSSPTAMRSLIRESGSTANNIVTHNVMYVQSTLNTGVLDREPGASSGLWEKNVTINS